MAVPIDNGEASATAASGGSSVASTTPNSPSQFHPLPTPQASDNQPRSQVSAAEFEKLVQAYYEALHRCSQGKSKFDFKIFNRKLWKKYGKKI